MKKDAFNFLCSPFVLLLEVRSVTDHLNQQNPFHSIRFDVDFFLLLFYIFFNWRFDRSMRQGNRLMRKKNEVKQNSTFNMLLMHVAFFSCMPSLWRFASILNFLCEMKTIFNLISIGWESVLGFFSISKWIVFFRYMKPCKFNV